MAGSGRFSVLFMVKPDLDLWTGTDPIFRVVNRFCILCLIGSQVGSGNERVGSFLLLTPTYTEELQNMKIIKVKVYVSQINKIVKSSFDSHTLIIG
ncbi:hypothetical protein Hanom_Chr12g01110651 [Helianthus anomalus]